MMSLALSGVLDTKIIAVTINRLEHIVVVRKNIAKPEDLKGKRIAVSRIGSASDITTRMVLRSWKIDTDKDIIVLQSGIYAQTMKWLMCVHYTPYFLRHDN